MIERIARTCFRRRRAVVAAWALLLVALTVAGGALAGEYRNGTALPGTESQAASDLLEAGGFAGEAGQAGQLVYATPGEPGGVEAPATREAVAALSAAVEAAVPGVEVDGPDDPGPGGRVAPGGEVAYADLLFGTQDYDDGLELARDVVDVVEREAGARPDGLRVELGGELFWEPPEAGSESIGLLAAVVILLIAFGSVLAMGLPLATAVAGLVSGLAVLQVVTRVLDVPDFGPAMLSMVAVGVGIDYALFIVTRYREELAAGREPEDATVRSFATSGRAVAFAGVTVVLSLSGMLLGGVAMIRSLAVAAALGVVAVLLATLTLLPALLGFCGRSIDRLSVRRRSTRRRLAASGAPGGGHAAEGGGLWARWARFVQRRPLPVALAGVALLLALAAPVTVMRLGFSDAGNRADDDTARQAYDLLGEGFGAGENGPFVLAADLPGDAAADAAVLDRLLTAVAGDPGIASVGEPVVDDAGEVAVVTAVPTSSPQDEATVATVARLRHDVLPAAVAGTGAEAHLGGATAGSIDFSDFQAERLPLFFAAVLVLSFVLLMVVFRSVLVPLKAVVMNLLSIGAAYGVVVAVFQWGWGAGLLGVGEPGPVEAWAPMMLFAVVFGLSMDYEVFLLSRIREEYDRTGDNATAVSDGLARTARLITAAAAIMLCVFGGFVLSPERSLQVFGLGLAVAVAVDATVVRLLLVPATMELLGERNWWLPGWLGRLLPRARVERDDAPAGAPSGPAAPERVGAAQ